MKRTQPASTCVAQGLAVSTAGGCGGTRQIQGYTTHTCGQDAGQEKEAPEGLKLAAAHVLLLLCCLCPDS